MNTKLSNQNCHIAYATAIGFGFDVLSPVPSLIVAIGDDHTIVGVVTRFGVLDQMSIELGKRDIAHNLNPSSAKKAMEVIASMTSCILARIPCEAANAIAETGSIGMAGAGDATIPLCHIVEDKTSLKIYTEPDLDSLLSRGNSVIWTHKCNLPFVRKCFLGKIVYNN